MEAISVELYNTASCVDPGKQGSIGVTQSEIVSMICKPGSVYVSRKPGNISKLVTDKQIDEEVKKCSDQLKS